MWRRWHGQRRVAEPDRWLDERGLYRKHMPRDPSCLFRALSEKLYGTQRFFQTVRAHCLRFMTINHNLFRGSLNYSIETYLKEMSNPLECGGFRELEALSHVYGRDFVVFEMNKNSQTKICNGYGREILLFYIPETKHFDAVYTKEHIANSAFCQSVMYEVLFGGVFRMKDLFYAVDKMLHEKLPVDHVEFFMAENVERRRKLRDLEAPAPDPLALDRSLPFPKCKHQTAHCDYDADNETIFVINKSLNRYEDVCLTCLDVDSARELLRHGITPFPYKVAKALDPNIYRNIEFDAWSEIRKEVRYGLRYADGTALQVGVKCLCRLRSDQEAPYYCHIQEMHSEAGTALVFVEEVGIKTRLRLDQLESLPKEEARPWAPPYRHSRSHSHHWNVGFMLQQLGNIARKHAPRPRKVKCDEEKRLEGSAQCGRAPSVVAESKEERAEYCQYAEAAECAELSCQMNVVMCTQCVFPPTIDLSAYSHMDYYNFEPYPVEVTALPLMVDCRPVSGAAAPAPDSAPPAPASAAAPPPPAGDNQPPPAHPAPQAAGGASGMAAATPPATVARASTPAAPPPPPFNTYSGGMGGGGYVPPLPYAVYGGGAGVKGGVVMVGPPLGPAHPPAMHPAPHNINTAVARSVLANGSDLPMNDIPTLRYFFNMGVDCMLSGMYPLQPAPQLMPPPPPHAYAPPPRFFSPFNDLAQEMQQNLSLQERERAPPAGAGSGGAQNGDHKGGNKNGGGGGGAAAGGGAGAQDKPPTNQSKGNGQRSLLGPRFKRGNGEGNYGNYNNHGGGGGGGGGGGHQNRNYYNNRGGGGMNNRRSAHAEPRGMGGGYAGGGAEAECGAGGVEPAMMPVPYVQYPPPIYHYYQPEPTDPGMMGMMGGVSYMGYMGEEVGEQYAAPGPLLPPYFPPYHQPPPHHHDK